MRLVDTHCHLTFPQYDQDREELIERIFSSNLAWVLNACSSLDDIAPMKDLAMRYPDRIFLSIGVHPHYAEGLSDRDYALIKEELASFDYKAVGEVGIDLFRNLSPLEAQKEAFSKFIQLARDFDKPLIVHSREADEVVVGMLKEADLGGRFVVHCFSGGVDFARQILDMGGMISVTGNITYKKSNGIREAIRYAPLDKIMAETDSPYLAPQIIRGKRNDPSFVLEVYKAIAEIKSVDLNRLMDILYRNAALFFEVNL